MPLRARQETLRYICHQCLNSSAIPPSTSNSSSQDGGEEANALRCRFCGSEFIELLEPSRSRSRQANLDQQGEEESARNHSSAEEEGDEEEEEERERRRRRRRGGGGRGGDEGGDDEDENRMETMSGPTIIMAHHHPLGHPHPIQLLDLLGLFTGQRVDTSWRQAFGLYSDSRDYVFTEEAFQSALQTLFDQMGVKVSGLREDQLATLNRSTIVTSNQGENNEDGGECAVCQEGYREGETIVTLICKHRFHENCIIPWLTRVASCPVCRVDPMTGNLIDDKEGAQSLS